MSPTLATAPNHQSPPPSAPRTSVLRRVVRAGGAAAVGITGLAIDRGPIGVLIVVFVLVVPFEKLFPRHRQRLRRPQLATDMAYALATPLLGAVGAVVGLLAAGVSLLWLPALGLRPAVSALPGPLAALVGFVLFDLIGYWAHRLGHEVPFLWRFHRVHHSTEHLDWVSGFRLHPFDGLFVAPAFVFLVAAGFSPRQTGILAVVQVLAGLFLHANVRWRLQPLQRWIATPEFHHWHHADEPDAHHTNYAALLPVWDLLFATFLIPAGRRPQRYGISEELPKGMIAQLWSPFIRQRRAPRSVDFAG